MPPPATRAARIGAAPDLAALAALAQAARYPELEARAEQLLTEQPECGLGWKLLGFALWQQRKEALGALERAAILLPADSEAQGNLGNALRLAGRLEEAVEAHRRSLAIDPAYAEGHNNLGTLLRDLGSVDEAVACFRKAVRLKPSLSLASANLGSALLGLGQFEEAAACFRRTLDHNPRLAAAHSGLGRTRLRQGRPADAAACFRQEVSLTPESAGAHHHFGDALLELGRPAEAAASYERALSLSPDLIETHCNLGSAFRDLGDLESAAACYRRALALRPDSAEIHNNLGIVLRLQHDSGGAESCARRAHDLNPGLAGPLVSLGRLKADRGEFAEAEELYRRALHLDPAAMEACSAIAHVRRMSADDTSWLTTAQRLLAQDPPPRQEAHLRYALGKYFDDVGDASTAFPHFRRANELKKRFQPAHDPDEFGRLVDRIMQLCDREWMDRQKVGGPSTSRPVFVVGMPRSGTSLAEQILASHPAVRGAGELAFWSLALRSAAGNARASTGREPWLSALAEQYIGLLASLGGDADRVVDKMPGNFLALGLIHAALPHARIIHMRRHPIDTCLSAHFQDFEGAYSYAHDLDHLARYYQDYWRLMEHWRATLPRESWLEVSYEQLIGDQEGWSRSMVAFLGLEWDARCLDFHRNRRSVITASNWQVRQRIGSSSVGRWHRYERHVSALLKLESLA